MTGFSGPGEMSFPPLLSLFYTEGREKGMAGSLIPCGEDVEDPDDRELSLIEKALRLKSRSWVLV